MGCWIWFMWFKLVFIGLGFFLGLHALLHIFYLKNYKPAFLVSSWSPGDSASWGQTPEQLDVFMQWGFQYYASTTAQIRWLRQPRQRGAPRAKRRAAVTRVPSR